MRLSPHLTPEELEARYRTAERPLEMKHWQTLLLLSKGWRTADIAEAVGYTVVWIHNLAKPTTMTRAQKGCWMDAATTPAIRRFWMRRAGPR